MAGELPETGVPEITAARQKSRAFVLKWIAHRQGSPAELIRALEEEAGWPYRLNLSHNVAEIEAESVAYIVCRRAGVRTHSAEYLSSFVEDSDDLDSISLDLVSRAAGRIEEMGRRRLAPRESASHPAPENLRQPASRA